MSPAARRAAHQALDLFLDALAEDERAPKKKRRGRAPANPPALPKDVTPEELQESDARLRRAGYS